MVRCTEISDLPDGHSITCEPCVALSSRLLVTPCPDLYLGATAPGDCDGEHDSAARPITSQLIACEHAK